MKWFVDHNGRENGPFTSSQVRKLAAHGKITRETLIRREADTNWFPASRVQNLFTDRHSQNEPTDSQYEHDVTFAAYSYADESADQQVIDSVAEHLYSEPVTTADVSPFALITTQSTVPDKTPDEVIQPPKHSAVSRKILIRSLLIVGSLTLVGLLTIGGRYGMRVRLLGIERAEVGTHLRKASVATATAIAMYGRPAVTYKEAFDRLEKDIELVETCIRDVQMIHRTSDRLEQDMTDEYLTHCQSVMRLMRSTFRKNLEASAALERSRRLLEAANKSTSSRLVSEFSEDAIAATREAEENRDAMLKHIDEIVSVTDQLKAVVSKLEPLYSKGDLLTDSQATLRDESGKELKKQVPEKRA